MGDTWDRAMRRAFGRDDEPPGPHEGETLGDFRIVREVGRGGMGVVYEARQVSLDRTVALKILPYHLTLDSEAAARFTREARVTAKLEHPGIVEIHTVGEENGTRFYAMEFVEGAPLDRVLAVAGRRGLGNVSSALLGRAVSASCHRPRSAPSEAPVGEWSGTHVEAALELAIQVAEALDHAHERGVVHRDVKPANILVREDGTAVLTDFGLARGLDSAALTRTTDLAGTPHYVAPECVRGGADPLDRRRDVYSLGATLYEMLTLRRPFDGGTAPEVFRRILEEDPPNPRRLNPAIGREFSAVVQKAMEKEPGRRYRSAAELAADLRAVRDGGPVTARPVSAVTRGWRVVRRRRRGLTIGVASLAAGVLAAALLLGSGVTRDPEAVYWSNVNLALAALDEGNPEAASSHLAACDEELRGWEWRHLKLRADLAEDPPPDAPEADPAAPLLPLIPYLPGGMAISPEGDRVAVAGWHGRIGVFDLTTGERRFDVKGEWHEPRRLAFDERRGRLLVGAIHALGAWDPATGRLTRLERREGRTQGLALTADGHRAVFCSEHGEVVLLDLETGGVIRSWRTRKGLASLVLHPDGLLLVGYAGGRIGIFRLETGESLGELEGHCGSVERLALSPDGETLYSVSFDRTLRRWDLTTRTCTHDVYLGRLVRSVAVSPDGSRVVCGFMEMENEGSSQPGFSVRSAANPALGAVFRDRDGRVEAIAFTPDGKRLLTNRIRVHETSLAAARGLWPVVNLHRRGEEYLDRLKRDVGAEPEDETWLRRIRDRVNADSGADPALRRAVVDLAEQFAYRCAMEWWDRSSRLPPEAGIPLAERVCALNPSSRSFLRVARLRYRGGLYREVLPPLAEAERRNLEVGTPWHPDHARVTRAACLCRLGDTEEARRLFARIDKGNLFGYFDYYDEAESLILGSGD